MKEVRSIVVAIDFSDQSMGTSRLAKLLAERWRAQLTLLHVVAPPPPIFLTGHLMAPILPSSRPTGRPALKRLQDLAFELAAYPPDL